MYLGQGHVHKSAGVRVARRGRQIGVAVNHLT